MISLANRISILLAKNQQDSKKLSHFAPIAIIAYSHSNNKILRDNFIRNVVIIAVVHAVSVYAQSVYQFAAQFNCDVQSHVHRTTPFSASANTLCKQLTTAISVYVSVVC